MRINEFSLTEPDAGIQIFLNTAPALSRLNRPQPLPVRVTDLTVYLRQRRINQDFGPDDAP